MESINIRFARIAALTKQLVEIQEKIEKRAATKAKKLEKAA